MRICLLVTNLLVLVCAQIPSTSSELGMNAPGEGGSFKGFFTTILFGGDMPKNPMTQYLAIQGVIQNQINNQLNNQYSSELIQSISTLWSALNDMMNAYLAQVNSASVTNITVESSFVDSSMSGIDALVSSSLDWYQAPQFDPRKPTAFLLTDVKGLGYNLCLHTQAGSLKPGTNIVVDTACDLNSLDDKTWAIGKDNRLILRTNLGDMCVAYKKNNGQSTEKQLAIYSLRSPACKTGRPIRLYEAKDGTWSIYDNNLMLCVRKPKWYQFMAKIPVVVNPTRYRCENKNFLQFQARIPLNVNAGGVGGATANSITPARTFDEIGVQLYYFPLIASIHIAALKEMYQFGTLKDSAQSQFTEKTSEYMLFIAAFLPMFDSYSQFIGLDSKAQVDAAMKFFKNLQTVTLDSTAAPQS